jgi:hypothetical protein
MGSLLYECASHEKLDLLPFWIAAFQLQWQINRPAHYFVGAQLSLILSLAKVEHNLLCPEIIASIHQSLKSSMDTEQEKKKKNKLAARGSSADAVTMSGLIGDTDDIVQTNNLFSFEGLSVMPPDANVSSKNPLYILKSRLLKGRESHSLTELTKLH